MGIYIDLPLGGRIQSKKDWLKEHGQLISPNQNAVLSFTQAKAEGKRYCFWQIAGWGENVALAYSAPELIRLAGSHVFPEIYIVPVEDLKAAGVRV